MKYKQTAVEWLVEQIKDYDFTPVSNNEEYLIVMPQWIFNAKTDEAKEMEKEKIESAYREGYNDCSLGRFADAEKYYNETLL
jgi:hypothetical protein